MVMAGVPVETTYTFKATYGRVERKAEVSEPLAYDVLDRMLVEMRVRKGEN
jgi:hypothetical protein